MAIARVADEPRAGGSLHMERRGVCASGGGQKPTPPGGGAQGWAPPAAPTRSSRRSLELAALRRGPRAGRSEREREHPAERLPRLELQLRHADYRPLAARLRAIGS